MKYLIGIDAGGSKTECILTDGELNILNTVKGPGFNLTNEGPEKAAAVLNNLLPELIKGTASPDQVSAIALAAAGAGRQEIKDNTASHLKETLTGFNKTEIKVYSDAEAAYAASFPEGKGFILISGTGSIIFGKDNKGKYLRAGGYGRSIDEGNGYSLGRKAFIHTSAVIDKFFEKDKLSEAIMSEYNIATADDLINVINSKEFNFADAAKIVLDAAETFTPSAEYIIDEETNELLKLIYSIHNQTEQVKLRLSFHGSLLTNTNIFSDMLKEKLAEQLKEVKLIEARYSPAIGSILLLNPADNERNKK